jgi:hypothetical protein
MAPPPRPPGNASVVELLCGYRVRQVQKLVRAVFDALYTAWV